MRKTTTRKKPARKRKWYMGPAAAIVAAAVGGIFSLSSALVSRLVPARQAPSPSVATQPMAMPIAYNDDPLPRPHEIPVREPQWTTPIQLELSVNLPSFPTSDKPLRESPAAIAEGPVEQRQPLKQTIVVQPSIADRQTVAVEQPPQSVQFEASRLAESLSQAESRAPQSNTQPNAARPKRPNLTYGVWTIFAAKDARGNVWNNSTLKITSQQETPDGLKFAGFLDWRANGRSAGREYVVGNYVEDTRSVFLQGHRFDRNDRRLALSSCSAQLSEDGRHLTNGTWGSATARRPATPGRWEARR